MNNTISPTDLSEGKILTAKELISKLRKVDPDTRIFIPVMGDGFHQASYATPCVPKVVFDDHKEGSIFLIT